MTDIDYKQWIGRTEERADMHTELGWDLRSVGRGS